MNGKKEIWALLAILLMACSGSAWPLTQLSCEPPNTLPEGYHVLISSCNDANLLDISPGGNYLLVVQYDPAKEYFIVDVRTNETTTIYNAGVALGFLDENTVILGNYRFWLVQEKETIQSTHINVEDTPDWVRNLVGREALIFPFLNLIYGFDPEMTLLEDPPIAIRYKYHLPIHETIASLEANHIPYQILDRVNGGSKAECFETECISHNGSFELNRNLIFTASGIQINPEYDEINQLIGWSFDDRRVYGNAFEKQTNTGFLFASRQLHPSGVIYYEIPEEYFYP